MSKMKLSGEYHEDVNMLLDEISRILEARTEQFIGELSRSARATDEIARLKADIESLSKDAERYRWLILHADEIYVHPSGYFGQNLSVDSFDAKKGGGVKIRVDAEIDSYLNSSPENPS